MQIWGKKSLRKYQTRDSINCVGERKALQNGEGLIHEHKVFMQNRRWEVEVNRVYAATQSHRAI